MYTNRDTKFSWQTTHDANGQTRIVGSASQVTIARTRTMPANFSDLMSTNNKRISNHGFYDLTRNSKE